MALRQLLILDASDALGDLRVPPGNRLEKQAGSGERWLGEVHNQELPDLEAEDVPAALHYAAEAVREYELPLRLPA
jgi:uncharacterized protein (DUF433 family)